MKLSNLTPQTSVSRTIGIRAFITAPSAWFISSKKRRNCLSSCSSIYCAHAGIAESTYALPLLSSLGTGIPPRSVASHLSRYTVITVLPNLLAILLMIEVLPQPASPIMKKGSSALNFKRSLFIFLFN